MKNLPNDAFNSELLARSIWRASTSESSYQVIFVEGGWGTGKTDVLRRLVQVGRQELGVSESSPEAPYFLDPWTQRNPNFIELLINEVMTRDVDKDDRPELSPKMLKAAELAKYMFGLGTTVAAVATANPLLLAAGQVVSNTIETRIRFWKDGGGSPGTEMEQVTRSLADFFAALVSESERGLIVCIDDIDRCLPEHQVRVLEALAFLRERAPERLTFVVALDAGNAAKALQLRYHTGGGFDADAYLAKIADVRFKLPLRSSDGVARMARERLSRSHREALTLWTGEPNAPDMLCDTMADVWSFIPPERRNPRAADRVLGLLKAILAARPSPLSKSKYAMDWAQAIAHWLFIAQLCPAFRAEVGRLEHPGPNQQVAVGELAIRYLVWKYAPHQNKGPGGPSVPKGFAVGRWIGDPSKTPDVHPQASDLIMLLKTLPGAALGYAGQMFWTIDRSICELGL